MNICVSTMLSAVIMPLKFKIIKGYFKIFICLVSLFFSTKNLAQTSTDTLKEIELEEVIIKAYEQNIRLKEVPAAINLIGKNVLNSFGPASIISAINTSPGVRMEERSPGSYRFNIRGSSLRSPFGIRNVKVYYNDLPYTNPGGQTFLNQLGYYNFNSIEIIKGPGSSLYGAGTGGVLLIDGMNENDKPGLEVEYTIGSFGAQNVYAAVTTGGEKYTSKISYQHQNNNGYRNHSALKRDVLSWLGSFRFGEKNELKTTFIYGDLFYETPGGLTLTEFQKNPRAARAGNAFFPGAAEANASVRQKTFLAGASYTQKFHENFQNKIVLYGAYTQLLNPNIQAAERSTQPHFGGRTVFKYTKELGHLKMIFDAGAELQKGFTNISIHKNVSGNADSIRTYDEIENRQSLLFTQVALKTNGINIVASASLNNLNVGFKRFIPAPLVNQKRSFNNILAPRFALSKEIKNVSIYSSIGKGFSPPTTEELLPSGGTINLQLGAENGINYDLGFRSTFFNKLNVDINTFLFQLKNTIVQRRDAAGGSFFLNAGKTNQRGIETSIIYQLFESIPLIDKSSFWLSHTYHNFKYKDFVKDTNDFSGKYLPGIAPHTISSGINVSLKNGFSTTLSYLFNGKMPLNDANGLYAESYHLVAAKIGFQQKLKENIQIKLSVGVDNLLNETYSLGNDINAFGGRYYNAAQGRNYFATISFKWIK